MYAIPTTTTIIAYSVPLLGALASWVFQRRKYAASITKELGLESFTTYVKRGFGYKIARYLRPRAAARLSLRDFAINRLAASPSKIKVPAAVPVELSLDKMFVPLTVLSGDRERMSAQQIGDSSFRRILLVGDPGSGKSTLVNRMYRDICRNSIMNPAHGRIPVLIELKNIDVNKLRDSKPDSIPLYDLIRADVATVRTYSGDNLFDSLAESGRLTVFLDGLDEIRTDDFDDTAALITQLCDKLARVNEKNRVIVTTRRQLYVNLSHEFTIAFDSHFTLEPFTPDDTYEFLQRWPYKKGRDEEVSRIFSNLAEQPQIRAMCESPLILAMYVATDQLAGQENLPETRPDFYTAVTDELLVRRRGRQFGLTTGLNVLRRQRQRLIGRIALEHLLDQAQSRNTVQWDMAVRIVADTEGVPSALAEQHLRELSRDTGIFTEERREETLRFAHLTFCEFFAAQAIAQGDIAAWKEITRRVTSRSNPLESARATERFAEVIIFASALETNAKLRQRRVRWVMASGEPDLVLRTIIDCQPYDDEPVMQKLENLAAMIADVPANQRDDSWFHTFRQVATTLRGRELVGASVAEHAVEYLAPFFVRAVGDSSMQFAELFISYMRLDTAGALNMARSMRLDTIEEYPKLIIKSLDEPAVLAHAIAEFSATSEGMRHWASVLATGALRYNSVSSRLLLMRENDDVRSRLQSEGRKHGWQRGWRTRESFLGQVLEAGCRWPASMKSLRLMATVPVRRKLLLERLFGIRLGTWLLALAFLAFAFTILRTVKLLFTVGSFVDVSYFTAVLLLTVIYLYSVLRRQPNRFLPTNIILSGAERFGRRDMDHPLVQELFEADPPIIPVYESYKIDRQWMKARMRAERVKVPLAYRVRNKLPLFLALSPNSKLTIFASVCGPLLFLDLEDEPVWDLVSGRR